MSIHLMLEHCFVALLAVGFSLLFLQSRRVFFQVLWGLLWLLLVPNTAYILTDLEHFAHQWSTVASSQHVVMILRYTCLEIVGIVTFIVAAIPPFERIMGMWRLSRRREIVAIVLFNLLVGFGVVLGKWEHFNSYVVFTQPLKIALSIIHIVTSPRLVGLTVLFGVICNGVYFLARNAVLYHAKT